MTLPPVFKNLKHHESSGLSDPIICYLPDILPLLWSRYDFKSWHLASGAWERIEFEMLVLPRDVPDLNLSVVRDKKFSMLPKQNRLRRQPLEPCILEILRSGPRPTTTTPFSFPDFNTHPTVIHHINPDSTNFSSPTTTSSHQPLPIYHPTESYSIDYQALTAAISVYHN